jgi:hypothetical protein
LNSPGLLGGLKVLNQGVSYLASGWVNSGPSTPHQYFISYFLQFFWGCYFLLQFSLPLSCSAVCWLFRWLVGCLFSSCPLFPLPFSCLSFVFLLVLWFVLFVSLSVLLECMGANQCRPGLPGPTKLCPSGWNGAWAGASSVA